MNNWIKSLIFACCINECYGQRNYVEISNFQKWNYDAEIDPSTLGQLGAQLPNYFDAYTTSGAKVIFSANGPMFRTEDGFLYSLDNEKITIDPDDLVKGIVVDVYAQLPGKYYLDFTALGTNNSVIAKVSKEKTFSRAAFQPNSSNIAKTFNFGIESIDVNIDKFIVSLENITNKIKRFSLNNIRFIEKVTTSTNNITIIEGFPFILQSNISGKTFNWYKEGQLLASETNNFLKIDFAVEGDSGQYTFQSGGSSVIFNVSFKRTIKILINDQELENYYNIDGRPEVAAASKITLIPFVADLPIRYTLDGSEPTDKSALYTTPFNVDKTVYLRAKIEIPETDSTRIKVSGGSN
jgi:hypothetical protein